MKSVHSPSLSVEHVTGSAASIKSPGGEVGTFLHAHRVRTSSSRRVSLTLHISLRIRLDHCIVISSDMIFLIPCGIGKGPLHEGPVSMMKGQKNPLHNENPGRVPRYSSTGGRGLPACATSVVRDLNKTTPPEKSKRRPRKQK